MAVNAADQIEQAQEQLNWHWRNSMRPIRFFNLDYRAIAPFLALLFYARLVTLVFCIIFTIGFAMLERTGLTFPSAIRKLRSMITGEKRYALQNFRQRKFIEYI
jgi:intracellular multiplication protein IcmT